MATQTIYHIALVTHIIGLTMMAGTTLVDFIIFKQFWKQLAIDRQKAIAIRQATAKITRLFGLGFLFLLISGITMMGITHGVFGEQLWFRVKFAFILAIVINGLLFGRRQGLKLKKLLSEAGAGEGISTQFTIVKRNLNWVHLAQMFFFITIFTLSVFKFN